MIDTTLLSPTSIAISIIGGLGAGIFLHLTHPSRPRGRAGALLTLWQLVVIGFLFYPGRLAAALIDVPSAAPSLVSGFLLWLVFGVCACLGTYALARSRIRR